MPEKKEFKPEISRVCLNPEQAVLMCSCYDTVGRLRNSFYGSESWYAASRGGFCTVTGKNKVGFRNNPSGTGDGIPDTSSS